MLLRSLGAGVSGLKNFQTDLDVIGNNIANVDTYGFKKSRVNFEDMFSQQLQGAQSSGGTSQNAIQVGLGSQSGSIDNIVTAGTPTSTGNPYDLAIDGDGYFKVQDTNGDFYYTRAGDFKLDNNGDLVNSQGMTLLNTANGTINLSGLSSFSIAKDGKVTGTKTDGSAVSLGTVALYTFPNAAGLEKDGNSLYSPTAASGAAGTTGTGTIVQNALEGSNVDLTDEMTNLIEAQRAYQANAQTITTADQVLQTLVGLKR